MEQMVLIAKALDTDYQAIERVIEAPLARKPPEREHALLTRSTRG